MPGYESFGWLTIAWIVFVLGFAGFVHGALGLGYPLVATPLLALVIGFKAAVALVLLPTMAVVVAAIILTGGLGAMFRRFWMLPPYMIAGSIAGTATFILIDPRPLLLLLSLAMFAFLAVDWRVQRLRARAVSRGVDSAPGWVARHPRIATALFGTIGGFCEGGVNVAAPPLVVLFLGLGLAPAQLVQALNLCFLAGKSTQILVLAGSGSLTVSQWLVSLPFAVLAVVVQRYATRIRERIDAATYRSWLKRFLLVMAIGLAAQFGWLVR